LIRHGGSRKALTLEIRISGGGRDSFFDSKIKFKCKDIDDQDIHLMRNYLAKSAALPKIYLAYRTLYEIFSSWYHHAYKDDLRLLSLECAHLRYRLDRKVADWELQLSG